ncbi:MAG: hypothetical protein ACO387_03315, partial [Flavobacteriaceae bacterium]
TFWSFATLNCCPAISTIAYIVKYLVLLLIQAGANIKNCALLTMSILHFLTTLNLPHSRYLC